MTFVHLHNHTQYSMLDGACRVDKMIKMAKKYDMPAVAMTDHGNMFGAIDFYKKAQKENIKPIIGIETYIINKDFKDKKAKKEMRHHLILLAKNLVGYKNLMKLSSIAYLEGFYYKPRINKKLLEKYSEGIICLSACLKGEIPQLLLKDRSQEAIEVIKFYKEVFQEDFYLELQDHGLEDEKIVAPQIIELAEETETPLVVTNDCHYLEKEDAEAHDVLLCIQTGKSLSDNNRMKYNTDQLYFKTEEEMRSLFPEQIQAYDNTVQIAHKIDLQLGYDEFLFPKMEIPAQYTSPGDYLKQLCNKAAEEKYKEITDEIEERINYELSIIHKMGYEEYFLIVKDFIDAARKMDIPVGPGRGSAVGSIVSYLLGITQIEPMKYGLFFERFLNPDRIGMPDIDIDFCAEGRDQIIDYVINKYGRESVAQIITFGKLGAKSVIKDVARAMDVPAAVANEITKTIPPTPRITLEQALKESPDFSNKMEENDVNASILTYSKVLEGLIRHSGVHAAGVVIAPGDLTDYVPLATNNQNNSELSVLVQYEGKWLDDLKMLKMDFLGLKTLTLIKKTVGLVKLAKDEEIKIHDVDIADEATYDLLSKGQTDGVFQFESAGMKKHLQNLQPNQFEDLIAMVALYRPGPMQFIDTFIRRKNGKEDISYVHPLTKNALKETYGVTVYQEQVMQIAREMGGLTGAEADTLRKAISKKKIKTMEQLKVKFVEGASQNGVKPQIIEKIWKDWQDFANYAFNKSHAAAYAYVAFQTAYLKAHYPVEFMAALLSLEDNPSKIPYFIEECNAMKIEVLPPNINNSEREFIVNGNKILFGLKAIKNVGSTAITKIITDREKNGTFEDIFDFCSRADSMVVNKAVLESLIYSGTMDELQGTRAQNFEAIEIALDYASGVQKEKRRGQIMLFDSFSDGENNEDYLPKLPKDVEWTLNEKLKNEKQILGFYWSGHPLNKYGKSLDLFTNIDSEKAQFDPDKVPAQISIAGVISEVVKKTNKRGKHFGIITCEDKKGKFEISLFDSEYEKYIDQMQEGSEIFIIGNKSNYTNGNENILRVIPKRIFPLEQMQNVLSGDYYIKIPEEDFTKKKTSKLIDILQQNPGKFSVHLSVVTSKFKEINLHPRTLKVYPNKQFYSELEKLTNIKQKVNLNFS